MLASAVAYGTPLLYAALGELLAERSGVLNLGVEGMMLIGAVMGFWTVQRVGGRGPAVLALAIVVAVVAGRGDGADPRVPRDHAAREPDRLRPRADDLRGRGGALVVPRQRPRTRGRAGAARFRRRCRTGQTTLPILGPILFDHSVLVYASWLLVLLVALYLSRTRIGLNVRAVGESPAAADAMGINVAAYRYAHTIAGGALAGVGGACFTLSITPQWVDGLTQGAGWIAIALVIFAFWRPDLCLVGAYFFGAFSGSRSRSRRGA